MTGFSEFLDEYFSTLSESQRKKLEQYAFLLETYNRKLNLISRADTPGIWKNHLIPSLAAEICHPLPAGAAVVDIGSGGGLPGIPLGIVRPDVALTLVDSSRKKAAFLRVVAQELKLVNLTIFSQRVIPGKTDISLQHRFDVMLARAVAAFAELGTLARFVLRQNGYLWTWKGQSDLPELHLWAGQEKLAFQIFTVPQAMIRHSGKLADLCYVAVRFDEDAHDTI